MRVARCSCCACPQLPDQQQSTSSTMNNEAARVKPHRTPTPRHRVTRVNVTFRSQGLREMFTRNSACELSTQQRCCQISPRRTRPAPPPTSLTRGPSESSRLPASAHIVTRHLPTVASQTLFAAPRRLLLEECLAPLVPVARSNAGGWHRVSRALLGERRGAAAHGARTRDTHS